jgi:rod shape determining protein RodA
MCKRSLRYFDWISFFIIVCIMAIGLLFIFSATYRPDAQYSFYFKKQLFGIIAGILIYACCCVLDYRWFMQWSAVAYSGAILLLLFTIIKGSIGMGAQRWIHILFFKIQPSELIKLLFPTFAATYLHNNRNYEINAFTDYLPLIITLFLSFLLILKQPDLGTALIVLFSGLILLWLSGLTKKFFSYGLLCIIITAPFSWNILKPYQKKRVLVFLGQGERSKERYQIEQSKIAIGSGGVMGKGFLQGTQNKLLFLPESRTDFIFSVICEEIGFIGACGVLCLYFLLFLRLIAQARRMVQVPMQLLAFGLLIPIILSTLINVCMVLGLLPIVGIPLPLLSYGLSNLWVTCATLGLFNAIVMHQLHQEA